MIEVNQYTIATLGEMVEAVLADFKEKLEAGVEPNQEHIEALKVFAAKLENTAADLSMLLKSF